MEIKNKFIILSLSMSLCLSVLLVNGKSYADNNDKEAKAAFDKGSEFFENQQYNDAAIQFKTAYNFKPSWKLFYNIGQCEALLKRYGLALEAFESYISDGGDDIAIERQEEILSEIKKLRNLVGSFDVDGAEDGTDIFIDDIKRGTTPLTASIMISAGIEHTITAKIDDTIIYTQVLKLNGQQHKVIDIHVDATKPEQTDETEISEMPLQNVPVQKEKSMSSVKKAGLITIGIGGAILIGGVITGALAMSINNDVKDDCSTRNCLPDRQGDLDKRDNLAITTNILLGIGAAAAITGVLMITVFDKRKKRKKRQEKVSIAPSFGNNFAGAIIEGRF
ncbi:MAG: hypothetical protein JXR91_12650 [Deltaproteobacteria bacterium]|nr:hypothetical protein [Deltaproteobacteria bacterium]